MIIQHSKFKIQHLIRDLGKKVFTFSKIDITLLENIITKGKVK